MPERTTPFTVRSAAEFGSGDARRVAGTAARRDTPRSSTPAVTTSALRSSRAIVRERRWPVTCGVAAAPIYCAPVGLIAVAN
jgi:hypothetical protein